MKNEDQLVAINAVCSHLGIEIAPPQRSLKEQKNPSSAREMACIVAYYLEHYAPVGERKNSISAEDITKYFKQAG